ncbi:Transcriptional regulator, MarR family OS=Tsukamurella paurometabola (strain ATCC 8368 / DSM/ CCUG 35730 / CIP 100753 / JCM 10117 / KCTC 9821 / NBRC 16120/ NCIMB 702349 / NCTC 13040) OX=521096 GN=Tpau_0728 PE=4 SV=1 [Tsukamurella paurometabola]|uniref:Transcriptional regulator, MarR family n=1 Tax=Tsukamurella paurometabola (strain ATCC 8368 / DSM 20162 / CCUG 35730 / CIP 100753 / JCM 10117 / KCTC 9821 / NBRC 16120 / NCIMB 702349 / NCTC 13040) TaxID=521096 RepID=D5UTL1_TSUPD|nr:MarR family transcriptional regulator [Tsukamurella paurometabola]ADG77365.1 transcriptional regulator, MarR family [Tsukamurella paurometabola DSM 20162]SUP26696.1 homoprotocatechuate degradation operon regulator, HpaR [Tsukamurella paurometabola]
MSDVSDLRYAVHSLSRELRAHRRADPGTGAPIPETHHLILGGLERHGPATPADLAQTHGVRAQTLTPALNALADAGLVHRRRDEKDRRKQYVELTPTGRAAVLADREVRNAWLEDAMNTRLTPLERDVVLLAAPILAKLADG